jgi:hypothetical protein
MQIMENRQSFSEDEISRIMRLSSHLSEYIDKESNPEVINDTELYQKHQLEFFDKSEAMINHIDRKFKKMIFLYKHPKDRVDFQPNSFLQPISLR